MNSIETFVPVVANILLGLEKLKILRGGDCRLLAMDRRTSNQRLKLETSKIEMWEFGKTDGPPINTDFFT